MRLLQAGCPNVLLLAPGSCGGAQACSAGRGTCGGIAYRRPSWLCTPSSCVPCRAPQGAMAVQEVELFVCEKYHVHKGWSNTGYPFRIANSKAAFQSLEQAEKSLQLFSDMKCRSLKPNVHTYNSVMDSSS